VGADANAPAEVLDCVINALLAGVADALHRVAANCAHAGCLVALPHVDGVGGVAKVKAASEVAFLEGTDLVSRRRRETES
jgi:hypothetical protein